MSVNRKVCRKRKAVPRSPGSPRRRSLGEEAPRSPGSPRRRNLGEETPRSPASPRRRNLGETSKPADKSDVTGLAVRLEDEHVAEALAHVLPPVQPSMSLNASEIFELMSRWAKPIFKACIPGAPGRIPSKAMLEESKKTVLRFLAQERELGESSEVVRAFYLASGEQLLRFDWDFAAEKVRRARLDRRNSIDSWQECLAMTSGDSNALSEIYVCGTRRLTQRALSSLICHESLHNLARRVRPGNPFLSEELEHVAMALIGDPQLVHETKASLCR